MSIRDINESLDFIGPNATLDFIAERQAFPAPTLEQVPPPSSGASKNSNEPTVQDPCVPVPSYRLVWLYNETSRTVGQHEKLVRENKELWAVLGFARYLLSSGVIEILEATSREGIAPINGPLLRHRVKELLQDAQDRLKSSAVPEPTPQLDA